MSKKVRVTPRAKTIFTHLVEPDDKYGNYNVTLVVPEAYIKLLEEELLEPFNEFMREDIEAFKDSKLPKKGKAPAKVTAELKAKENSMLDPRIPWSEATDKEGAVIDGFYFIRFKTKYEPKITTVDGDKYNTDDGLWDGSIVKVGYKPNFYWKDDSKFYGLNFRLAGVRVYDAVTSGNVDWDEEDTGEYDCDFGGDDECPF